jgi:hypothetical protein
MTDELLLLRADTYRSASSYHRAAGRYFDSLRPHHITTGHRSEVIRAYLETGRAYGVALETLIAYLLTNESESAELERARRITSLLEYEMSLI